MTNNISRSSLRPMLSPRYGTTNFPVEKDRGPIANIIPAFELRRLVAAMVD